MSSSQMISLAKDHIQKQNQIANDLRFLRPSSGGLPSLTEKVLYILCIEDIITKSTVGELFCQIYILRTFLAVFYIIRMEVTC